MSSMTRGTFFLVGALGADPDLVQARTEGQQDRVRLSVSQHDTNGHTSWAKVTCFGRQAEIAMAYCRKGAKVVIDGRLRPYTITIGDRVIPTIDLIADSIVVVHSPREVVQQHDPPLAANPPPPATGNEPPTATWGAAPAERGAGFRPRTRAGPPPTGEKQDTKTAQPEKAPPPLGVHW